MLMVEMSANHGIGNTPGGFDATVMAIVLPLCGVDACEVGACLEST